MPESLRSIIQSIDWNKNAADFTRQKRRPDAFEKYATLVSAWNHELSFYDRENQANSFLQEMKASLFFVPACAALGLTKPAASSMRMAVENALYYTYFQSHPIELETLHRNEKFFLGKSDIIDYHSLHSENFHNRQEALNFLGELNQWYSKISSIIHGQIPGVWSSHSLKETKFNNEESANILREYKNSVGLINKLFLSTINRSTWEGLSSQGRQMFLAEIDNATLKALNMSVF